MNILGLISQLIGIKTLRLTDCIKGKQTKHTKKGATRSTKLLEIIHTDIYGPFDTPSFDKKKNTSSPL